MVVLRSETQEMAGRMAGQYTAKVQRLRWPPVLSLHDGVDGRENEWRQPAGTSIIGILVTFEPAGS